MRLGFGLNPMEWPSLLSYPGSGLNVPVATLVDHKIEVTTKSSLWPEGSPAEVAPDIGFYSNTKDSYGSASHPL